MSECVSLIIWPSIANYSLISLWFYVQCQKLQKHYNGISILKRAYLHNHWFKLCEIKFIRKPRRSTILFFYNAKCDVHSIKRHTAYNLKLQNIAMLLEPTVGVHLRHMCKESRHVQYEPGRIRDMGKERDTGWRRDTGKGSALRLRVLHSSAACTWALAIAEHTLSFACLSVYSFAPYGLSSSVHLQFGSPMCWAISALSTLLLGHLPTCFTPKALTIYYTYIT
jgi:hypothetical protein